MMVFARGEAVHEGHWRVLEVRILATQRGEFTLKCLDEVASSPCLQGRERAFLLRTLLENLEETSASSQFAPSWAVVASEAIREFGLSELQHLVESVASSWKDSRVIEGNKNCNETKMRLLVVLTSGALQLESILEVTAIVALPKQRFWQFTHKHAVSPSSWLQQLEQKIVKSRFDKLGEDHSVEAAVRRFRASVNSGKDFLPHLFSFDGTPVFALTDPELTQLEELLRAMSCSEVPHDAPHLRADALKYGSEFRATRSIGALAGLLAALREGLLQVTSKQPYRIQCLCVGGFLLHQVNGSNRPALKGRLAQMATGEGKSLVVCMLALANALQGLFVDVITSTQSLAKRDAEEFKEVFDFFGVTSSAIAVSHPSAEHFNGQVLFGTNTDFEFALLRDGVYMQHVRMTQRNGHWVRRTADVAIVDESDNLCLDAASNSARLAHPSEGDCTWVYGPIFHLVAEKGVPG